MTAEWISNSSKITCSNGNLKLKLLPCCIFQADLNLLLLAAWLILLATADAEQQIYNAELNKSSVR